MKAARKRNPSGVLRMRAAPRTVRRLRYRIADLLAQMPPGPVVLDADMREWERMAPIGREIV